MWAVNCIYMKTVKEKRSFDLNRLITQARQAFSNWRELIYSNSLDCNINNKTIDYYYYEISTLVNIRNSYEAALFNEDSYGIRRGIALHITQKLHSYEFL